MRVKDKLIKQKQSITDRTDLIKRTDSTPMLMRLQRQYLCGNKNGHLKTQRSDREHQNQNICHYQLKQNKQNRQNMINSVPSSSNLKGVQSNYLIKIDNYEGKKFKTQTGYVPEMTKSRYDIPHESNHEDQNYSNQQKAILIKQKSQHKPTVKLMNNKNKICESVEYSTDQNDRPLTFGLIKNHPMKASLNYQQDRRIKNQVLDQINQLRKSKQTLYGSKDYSSKQFHDIPRCANHHNKKAKYRLMTEYEQKDQEMIYCSKCAINLLQQGFKVQEIQKIQEVKVITNSISRVQSKKSISTLKSSQPGTSRLQEMRNFQQKLTKFQETLQHNQNIIIQASQNQSQQLSQDINQTQLVYNYLIQTLQQMKNLDLNLLQNIKQNKSEQKQKELNKIQQEADNVAAIRKQMKEYRNKFIVMKETQFQFLINSFLNKIYNSTSTNTVYDTNATLEYRKCQLHQKVDRIVQSLWEYGKQIQQDGKNRSEVTGLGSGIKNMNNGHKTQLSKQKNNQLDEFMCQEIKRPFRTLFPDSDIDPNRQNNTNDDDQQQYSQQNQHRNTRRPKQRKNILSDQGQSDMQNINQGYYTNFVELEDDNGSPSFKK